MSVISYTAVAKQTRPTGPARAVTDRWLEDVQRAMAAQQPPMTPAELSRRVGVSTAAMSDLLTGKRKQTRIMPAIHRVLGMVEPETDRGVTRDAAVRRFLRAWADLSEEDRESVLQLAERLARPR